MTLQQQDPIPELTRWLLVRHPDCAPISLDTNLVEDVLDDSLEFIAFLVAIEDLRGSPIAECEVLMDSFRTLRTIRSRFFPDP